MKSKDAALGRAIDKLKKNSVPLRPQILSLSSAKDRNTLKRLLASNQVEWVNDDYEEQLRELFAVQNPTKVYAPGFPALFQKKLSQLSAQAPLWKHGKWTFYPWLKMIAHVLPDKDFQKVRTARNRNLITEKEQQNFYNATVGIAGLSVGNSVALTIAVQGGARHFRLADFDRLALSNLNRIRSGVQYLGMYKVEMTARQIYELNPYAKIEIFHEGITEKNITKFFQGPPKLDIIIDEIDSLAVKCLLRERAKKHRVPLATAADNGDNAVLEVERYDKNPNTPFFHNRMGKINYKQLKKADKFEIGRLITKWVGAETVTDRMKDSLLEMGKTIVSWPQLGGAAFLNGSAVAYIARKILNGQPINNDRALLSLDEKLIPNYYSKNKIKQRKKRAQTFKKLFRI